MECDGNLKSLPRGIERRSCPGCEYIIDQARIHRALINFDCPKCKKHTLNDFVSWPPKSNPTKKPAKRKAE